MGQDHRVFSENRQYRKMNLTESRLRSIIRESINNLLLIKSQESKSISAAKKLLMQSGYSNEQADRYVRIEIRDRINALKETNCGTKFIEGVTRMAINGELDDIEEEILDVDYDIHQFDPDVAANDGDVQLNNTIKYIYDKFDRNLNGISAKDLIPMFSEKIKNLRAKYREIVSTMDFSNVKSQSQITKINSFEEAQQYSGYKYQNDIWCLAYDKNYYERYTKNGANQLFFV